VKQRTLAGTLFTIGILVTLALPVVMRARQAAVPDGTAVVFAPPTLDAQRDSIVAQEARRAGNPVLLALAVSHVENWGGDSMVVSNAGRQDTATVRRAIAGEQRAIDSLGAVGLMQVLPRMWWHSWENECGCGSLFDRRRNACKGNRILRFYLDREPTVDRALRAYHGSSRHHALGDGYASAVLEQMTRLSQMTRP
jgi:soluble lytic murein transglycosylase-like protein